MHVIYQVPVNSCSNVNHANVQLLTPSSEYHKSTFFSRRGTPACGQWNAPTIRAQKERGRGFLTTVNRGSWI